MIKKQELIQQNEMLKQEIGVLSRQCMDLKKENRHQANTIRTYENMIQQLSKEKEMN